MDISFHSSGQIPRSEFVGSYGETMFSFVRNYWTVFQWPYDVTFPQGKKKKKVLVVLHHCQNFVLSVFWIFPILIAVSHWYFDLQFLNAFSASFHRLNCHLCILLFKVSVHILFLKKIRLYDFLLSSFKIFLYILDNSLLSDISFVNIISKSGLSSHIDSVFHRAEF